MGFYKDDIAPSLDAKQDKMGLPIPISPNDYFSR